jgi:pimeloyl-ACP methyl ester carboxylesterase
MSTYVLIHGAWHGAWCWEKLVPLLQQKGQTVITPDLPSHGQDLTPIGDITPQSYVQCVLRVLDAQPEPVILVGHSMGGIVISQVAEQRPEKINTLVYLAAVLLTDGASLPPGPDSVVLQNMLIDEAQMTSTVREEAIKEGFYADCSDEDVAWAKQHLVPEAIVGAMPPIHVTEARFGRVPRIYIECLQDRAVPLHAQKMMYSALPCQRIISMNTGHSPFFSAPEELSEHLISLHITGER